MTVMFSKYKGQLVITSNSVFHVLVITIHFLNIQDFVDPFNKFCRSYIFGFGTT